MRATLTIHTTPQRGISCNSQGEQKPRLATSATANASQITYPASSTPHPNSHNSYPALPGLALASLKFPSSPHLHLLIITTIIIIRQQHYLLSAIHLLNGVPSSKLKSKSNSESTFRGGLAIGSSRFPPVADSRVRHATGTGRHRLSGICHHCILLWWLGLLRDPSSWGRCLHR